jgi:predicted dehydrogenase
MADRLRIGLLGHGRWGQKLLQALQAVPGAELGAVCDGRFAELADPQLGLPASARIFSSAQQMFQSAELGAVLIATPSHTHAELALAALGHGLHVFVEKPLALDVKSAATVVNAAQQQRRVLMVGHILHHDAAVSIAYGLLHAGAIGQGRLFLAERCNVNRGASYSAKCSANAVTATMPRSARDAWWELAPHDIAVCSRVLAGAPEWVDVKDHSTSDTAVVQAILRSTQGVARLQVGYQATRVRRMAWIGDEGALLLQEDGQGAQLKQARLSNQLRASWVEDGVRRPLSELWSFVDQSMIGSTRIEIPNADALRGELSHFVYCALNGERPISDGQEGVSVVQVLAAGERALATGRLRRVAREPLALPGTRADASIEEQTRDRDA